jgi:hypothetical protein
MTKSKKGVQGFIKIPSELKRNKRGVFYLTDSEMKAFKEYSLQRDVKTSELIRERLKDIFEK